MLLCAMKIDRTILRILTVILLLATALSCAQQPIYPSPPLSGADAAIEIASLRTEVPQFYTYVVGAKKVNFFVLRMNDRILSFLDACITCYPKKRGYRYAEAGVACRACNMDFSIYKLEKGIGGCYPIKLEGRAENGTYRIPLSALERMADKF